jgi:hypothetical protein
MVLCFQNGSDLLWGKIVLLNWEKLGAEGQEFAKILRSLEQFIRRVKGQNSFGSRMLFKLIHRGSSDQIHQNNSNSSWKN